MVLGYFPHKSYPFEDKGPNAKGTSAIRKKSPKRVSSDNKVIMTCKIL